MEENRVERRLVMRVEKAGGKAYKWNPLGVKGVPDRMVLLPGGIIIFVETKAPGEKPRKLQNYRAKQLRNLGFRVECLDSVEKVDSFVKGSEDMQVIKDGIVKDYYISKELPENPSMKLLNHKLKYAERMIHDREKWLDEQRRDLKYYQSELRRDPSDRNKKLLEYQEDLIKRTLHNLEVEKEDLAALKDIIETEVFLGY